MTSLAMRVARPGLAIYVSRGSMPTRTQAPTDQPLAPPDADQPKVETSPRAGMDGQHLSTPAAPGVPLAPPGIPPESDVRVHAPSSAQPPPSHAQFDARLGELPLGYGDGRLVALVRDPSTLFVYWDFAQQQVEQAFFALGNARAVAKLWNVRGAGELLVREQEVHLERRGWYLRDLPPGTELRVEVWAVGEKGSRLLRAARPVRLPPALPSDQLEAFYLRVPLDHSLREGLYRGSPLQYGGAAPSEWDRRVHPRIVADSSPSRFPPGTLANQVPTAVPFGSSPAGSPWGSSPGGHFFGSSQGGHFFGSSPDGTLPWNDAEGTDEKP